MFVQYKSGVTLKYVKLKPPSERLTQTKGSDIAEINATPYNFSGARLDLRQTPSPH